MTPNDLKQWRERLGLTQEQAAALLGVSRPTYQRYEYGTIFNRTVPRTIAAAAYGASQAFREVLPIVAAARFERDPWGGAYRSTAMQFRPRNTYPDYVVAIHLAELLLDGRPIAAGKHKAPGLTFRIEAARAAPEVPELRALLKRPLELV